MKNVLIITTYNRPEYLEKCLASVRQINTSELLIILVDDNSTDAKTRQLFDNFYIDEVPVVKFKKNERKGVVHSLLFAIDYLEGRKFDYKYLINLDSDAIVKPNFIERLIEVKEKHKEHFVSGFNSRTRNRDGSERHIVIHEEEGFNLKKSVGGINMIFERKQVAELKEVLSYCAKHGGNWDHQISIAFFEKGFPPVCVAPSVVQHIGIRSSMGHNHEKPDIAEDFDEQPKTKLSSVALFILDTINPDGLIHAVKQSTKAFEFGEVLVMTDESHIDKVSKELADVKNLIVAPAFDIDSKEKYSRFMLEDLAIMFSTSNCSHVLIIQADGFIVNPDAWTNDFLKYDYIGAKWWFNDAFNVGNGGFSLRSMKLLQHVANADFAIKHPEDEVICRTYGKDLKEAGFKFAPEAIADKFSFEAYAKKSNFYSGSLGFHGYGLNFSKYPEIKKIVPLRANVKQGEKVRAYGHALKPTKR